ncbi:VOC family protein [Flexivirga meconopsidis]|jgi:predicted 3-demethylubiquinone-9 3-methyltransferase (glyoxalase superfamily)|uniref:VOC family protein n=1 Tax=Flexivirga meconopsidis TaxID=2977121 RepID=UPI00224055EF|nr:VOC family protein [Flexivirga meconopsidis]
MDANTLTTCLWFDDDAQAAAEFYTGLFPNSNIGQSSPMTVEFTVMGQPFLGLNGGPMHARKFNESISFQVPCADQQEVDRLWAALGDGGTESNCAWVQDRYGVWWQVIPTRLPELLADPDPARAERALQAMYQMRKIDVAALETAADATA